ncbi:MAG: hypothetical protein HQ494_14425 [Rhodospirillales bacterium]|nr:hypothetical protein [Rhodospirillales bacterium]
MLKRIILAALVGVLVSGPAWGEDKIDGQVNEGTNGSRYSLFNGYLAGFPNSITFLLDKHTGQTWMFVGDEKKGKGPNWREIQSGPNSGRKKE